MAMHGRPRQQEAPEARARERREREQRRRREQHAIPNPAFANRTYTAINENVAGVVGHPGTNRDAGGYAAMHTQNAGDYEAPLPVAMQDRTHAATRDQQPIPIRGPVYHEVKMYGQAPRGSDEYLSLDGNQQPYSGAGNQPGAGNYVSLDGNQRAYGSNSTA